MRLFIVCLQLGLEALVLLLAFFALMWLVWVLAAVWGIG